MKKILLLSDTHSHLDKAMLKYINQADEVWHAGDIGD
ncbi:metallophosphoesterase family protein, partial [Flavobacteriaceae bacterium]|nr:metallophosphoesterase family protein [Flavobacteriaceae bacterium]